MTTNGNEKILEKILSQLKSMPGGLSEGARSSVGGTDDSPSKSTGLISKLLEKEIQSSSKYLEIQGKIKYQEEQLVKLKSKGNKEESISDRLVQNLVKLENIRKDAIGKYNKDQKIARKKIIDDLKLENKALLEQEKHEKNIADLKDDQNNLEDKYYKKHKLLLKSEKAGENVKKAYNKVVNNEQLKDVAGAIKNQLKDLTGLNGGILGFLEQTLSSLWNQDSVMSKLSANYALSRKESRQIKLNITNAAIQTSLIGVKTEDLVKMQQSYTDEIGRSVLLTGSGLVDLAQMGVATGLGAEGAAQMAASMEQFGYSAEGSTTLIEGLMLRSKKIGVSNSVSTKKFQENLKVANSYTFKEGLQGVANMTTYSTKLRINMQSIAGFADKVSSPEGAIQAAASLQVLGGSFANMADPMKLLNQGITDMKGLTETYASMLGGLAKVDKKTGEVTINGYDRLRIKAASEAMGVNFDEMMSSVRTKAKRDVIESTFKLNPTIQASDEDTKNFIASLAEYKEGKGYEINVAGKAVQLSKLSPEDIESLQPKDDSLNLKTVAESTLGISDIIKNVIAAGMQRLVNELMPSVLDATDYLINIVKKIEGFITGEKSIGGALPNSYGSSAGMATAGLAGLGLGAKSARLLSKGGGLGMLGANTKTALGVGGRMGGKIPLIGALLAGGGEYLSSGSLSKSIGVGAGSAAGGWAGAASGAALGSLVGPIGTIVGGIIGGIAGSYGGGELGKLVGGRFDNAHDVVIPSGGRPIKLDSKDDVFAMKPGGAIANAIQPSLNVKKTFGGVIPSYGNNNGLGGNGSGKIDLNISGTLNLVAGNSATKISATELVNDRNFVRELTRIIGNQMSRDKNGGKFSGGLNNNSF